LMTMILRAAALAVGCVSLCACGTVTRGSNTAWEVNTTPPGATVKTTNNMQCDSTPCSLKMSRKAHFTATIAKPGYKTVEVVVTTKVATAGGAAMAGNVLLGGLIGAGVDVATGAMNDLTPNPVTLTLERDDLAAAPSVVAPSPPTDTALAAGDTARASVTGP
jgi:hypothetical protein